MGLGDWILATAEARQHNEETGLKVVFVDYRDDRPFRSEVFDNNPRIEQHPQHGRQYVVLRTNGGGRRPYHTGYDGERFYWNMDFKATPGELFLSRDEKNRGEECVLIEPHVKSFTMSRNKAWHKWQELVDSLPLNWVQLGPPEANALRGVRRVITKKFRDTLGWIEKASLVVTADGALQHAAAALGTPAVVLWGHLVPPSVLGYDSHTNICHATEWCGLNAPCPKCREAMDAISVQEVKAAIESRLLAR